MLRTAEQVRHAVAHSKERLRTLADTLQLTEAALVAAHVQPLPDPNARLEAQVLRRPPVEIAHHLLNIGPVMLLTRHQSAVSEVTDTITKVAITDSQLRLQSPQGDWIADLDSLQVGFTVQERARGVLRSSVQVFEPQGTATVKIYAVEHTQKSVWDHLIDQMEPSTHIDWQEYAQQRASIIPISSRPVSPFVSQALPSFLGALTEKNAAWAITVANTGMQQTFYGSVQRFVEIPDWWNYLDPNFNLHLAIQDCTGWMLEEHGEASPYSTLHILNAEDQKIVSIRCISELDVTPTEWMTLIQQHLGSTHFRSE